MEIIGKVFIIAGIISFWLTWIYLIISVANLQVEVKELKNKKDSEADGMSAYQIAINKIVNNK